MANRLNGAGKSYADSLVASGKVDKSSSWSFSADDGNKLLGPDGDDWANFGKHHLGINPDGTVNTKDRYRYPFAKGETLYRSALTAIRSRASQQGDTAIFDAAGALLDKIDGDDKGNRLRNAFYFPPYDPDADGDNDAQEASGHVSSAGVLVRQAASALTGGDMGDGSMAQVRQAVLAAKKDLPPYDPDEDGDNDAEEALDHLADAAGSLDSAMQCLTGSDAAMEKPSDQARSRFTAARSAMLQRPERGGLYNFPLERAQGPVNYRMQAVGSDSAEIFIYDVIGDWLDGVCDKTFAADLRSLGAVKQLDIHVNSPGGDVFQGRAITNLLAQHPAKKIAHVDALAASIASLIIMACDEIRIADGALIMIHEAWGFTCGNSKAMRKQADLLDSLTGGIADTYAARTKNKRAQIDQWMADETWFDAEAAMKAGFADAVDEPARVAAVLHGACRFRNAPAALKALMNGAADSQSALKRFAALRAA